MRHVVFGTLVAARLTDVGTKAANSLGMLASTCHHRRRKCADIGAVHIQRNAARHHLDVGLLQTRGDAVVAGGSASVAGVDAGLVFLVGHGEFRLKKNQRYLSQRFQDLDRWENNPS